MKYEIIKATKEYQKLYYLLKDYSLSESYISKLRHTPFSLLINDKKADMRNSVKIGDIVSFALNVGNSTQIKTCDLPLDIVYEDDYILVINKPANLTSNPTKSHYNKNLAGAVCNYMKNDENFVFRILNRLDKDTSGLVIIAKTLLAYNKIKNIDKTYEAICEGCLKSDACIIKPIYTENINGINTIKRQISPLGKDASTFVKIIKSSYSMTHISLKLINGRTHQIRLHLSSISHPLVGDTIYGKESELISHTALTCREISFNHPITNEKLNFKVDYPEDFRLLLEQLS